MFQHAVCIARLHPALDLVEDEAQLVDLVSAVEALTSCASFGDDLGVAVFPAAKRLGRYAQHLGDRADAVHAVPSASFHTACSTTMKMY